MFPSNVSVIVYSNYCIQPIRKDVIGNVRQAVQEKLALPVMVETVHTVEVNVECIV